jgi:hypothetical protein
LLGSTNLFVETDVINLKVAIASAAVLVSTSFAPAPSSGATPRAGDLAKPVDQYTGAEFAALVGGLSYGQGSTRSRGCRNNPSCDQGRRTDVRIDAVADADSLGTTNLGQFGVVAARAINQGADPERRYGMQPNAQYYLIVLPGNTWRLEEVTGQTHRMLTSGRFNQCNHAFVRGARADFKTCAQGAGSPTVSLALYQRGGDEPMWISCAAGCCTAEAY